MDVVLHTRPPQYGPEQFDPKAAFAQGSLTVLLLEPVELGEDYTRRR
jgi:hypothetical protein